MRQHFSQMAGVSLLLMFLVACTISELARSTIPATDVAALIPPTSTPEPTPTPEPPQEILFIGNSLLYHNDGVEHHMAQLAGSANPPLTIEA